MVICDLCGETKNCTEREIEGKKYDICADCWDPLARELQGKGRLAKEREIVLLPASPQMEPKEPTEPKPAPWQPPKIWGNARQE